MKTDVQGLIEEGEAFTALDAARAPVAARHSRWLAELAQRDRAFYRSSAIALLATLVLGFARTYFLKTAFHAPSLTPLLHLHGLVGTTWFVLLVVQTGLVSAGRVGLHMKLGIAGALVAAAFVPLGVMVPLAMARHGAVTPERLVFLIFPVTQALMFGGVVAAALWNRKRRPEAHKRLMLLGTALLVTPALSRLVLFVHVPEGARPLVALVLSAAFLLAGMIHDRSVGRRVHPIYLWGTLAILLSAPVRFGLGHTVAWQSLARHVVG
jgi:hypothetical protein